MVPKLEACVRAVRGGVARTHVIDGRTPHSLLLEVFTDEGIGTMILPEDGGDGGTAMDSGDIGDDQGAHGGPIQEGLS